MKRIKLLTALALVAICFASTAAQQQKRVRVDFKDFKLANGLRVLLVEDHTAPVVSIAVTYDVGSRDERRGRTGLAHLFEHMMFSGSQNVGRNEYSILIATDGGASNATTTLDRTYFYATVPANQLEMILFLEADRMRSLDLTQENLDILRSAVREERLLRVDNRPYGKTDEKYQETLYDNFAYKHPLFGSMDDLNSVSVKELKDFFRIYFAPNNAALAIVGDFKADDALAKIKSHFETIPSQPTPPKVDMTEPPQTAERRFTVEDSWVRSTQIIYGYKGIAHNTPEFYSMQVLNQALAVGQSSRLYQKLIKEKELVTDVVGENDSFRWNGAYEITATVAARKKLEEVEAVINEEIARLQREPIADWELTKAKNAARRSLIQFLALSRNIATRLTQYAVSYDDPGLINTQFDKYASVTKEDVKRVANKYLVPSNRTVAITIPRQKASGAPAGN
jgi:zinc protease